MHIHLDLVGGISGDMFVGALLDCFPELASGMTAQLERAGFADLVKLEHGPADDGTLTGTGFRVHAGHDAEGHHHRHYSEIRTILEDSSLDAATREAALGIFHIIAVAEAEIHGKSVDAVAFHEVGAWDSIADIVCAASVIAASGATSWSISPLPLGGGLVKTAHGMLPVPAPATALILKGFEFVDDGVLGERVTPTGAAIVRWLDPSRRRPAGLRLKTTGFGFGTKRFPGLSNVVRAMVFETAAATSDWELDEVLQLEFEIDDQTPEELALALDRLRGTAGVIDVVQSSVFGKKERQMAAIRLLADPNADADVTRACFAETTTLGIRRQSVARAVLRREAITATDGSDEVRVKVARRPGGATAKAEHDDLRDGNVYERRRQRTLIERDAEPQP